MSEDRPKPPTNYRALRAITERNLLIGFFLIMFVGGLGLIGVFYGGGAVLGGLGCLLLALALVGLIALILVGLGKLSEWLDSQ